MRFGRITPTSDSPWRKTRVGIWCLGRLRWISVCSERDSGSAYRGSNPCVPVPLSEIRLICITELRNWIRALPLVERDRLQEASRNYGLAMSSYCDRYVSALIEGEKVPRPELDPSVEQRIERFKSIGGFAKGWQRFVQNAASLRDVLATSEAGEAGESDGDVRNGTSLTVGDRAIMQNRLRTNLDRMDSKMENTIDDLFSQQR